jgi:hypothetical protein
MNKVPCTHCGQLEFEMFHYMEQMIIDRRVRAESYYRIGDLTRHRHEIYTLEQMKDDARRRGYDFHPYTPLTNLEYLEFKVAEKENRRDEILHKRYPFWSREHY